MEMKQCSNGHFFDLSKNATCPYCNGGNEIGVTRPLNVGGGFSSVVSANIAETPSFPKTTPIAGVNHNKNNFIPPTVPLYSPETSKTVPLHINEQGIDPVCGWLVCVKGNNKGKDFKIHTEKNFIGRSKSNDICLDFDETVSKDAHAIITYDIRTNKFWLQSGDGRSNIYVNEKIVLVPVEIKSYDVISIGKTELVFVSFCNENFKWK